MVGFIIVSVITVSKFKGDAGGLGGGVGKGTTGKSITLNKCVLLESPPVFVAHPPLYLWLSHTVILLLFVTGAALILSAIYLILTRMFTKAIMHITLILTILLNMYV